MALSKKLLIAGVGSMYAGMIGMVGIPAIQAMASYGAGGSIVCPDCPQP